MNTDLKNKCRTCLQSVQNIATLNIFDTDFRSTLVRFERLIGTTVITGIELPTKICIRCVSHIKKVLNDLDTWSQIQHNLNAQQIIFSVQENIQTKVNNKTTLLAPRQIELPKPSALSESSWYNQQSCVSPNIVMCNNTSSEHNNEPAKDCTLLDTINNDAEFISLLSEMNTTSTDFVEKLFDWSLDNINGPTQETNLDVLPIKNENLNQRRNTKLDTNAELLASAYSTNLIGTELHDDKNLVPRESPQNLSVLNAPCVLEFTKPYLFGNMQRAKSNILPTCTVTAAPTITSIISDGRKKSETITKISFRYEKETTKTNSLSDYTITDPSTKQSKLNPSLSHSRPLPFKPIENYQNKVIYVARVPKVENDKDTRPSCFNKDGAQNEAKKIGHLSIRKDSAIKKNTNNSLRKIVICKSKKPCLIPTMDFKNT